MKMYLTCRSVGATAEQDTKHSHLIEIGGFVYVYEAGDVFV